MERISLMISASDRAFLERIADEKRVSLAWVVRDAISRYQEQEKSPSESKKLKE